MLRWKNPLDNLSSFVMDRDEASITCICHSERSEEPLKSRTQVSRCARNDNSLNEIRRHIRTHQQHCRIIEEGMEVTMNTPISPAMA